MSETTFRLAVPGEKKQVIDFINQHFDWKLPLVNLPEYFEFYYQSGKELQYALAFVDGELSAVAGYIRANSSARPDIWVSVWVAKKGLNGVGLELMNALPELTGANVVACNNIRPKTMAFYRFLGWDAQRMGHFYRLAGLPEYHLAKISEPTILPVSGDLTLMLVDSPLSLAALGLPDSPHTPKKDLWYLTRRYFSFPHLAYQIHTACSEDGKALCYLVSRVVDSGVGKVLRIVDFVGDTALLPRLGSAINRLLQESEAEYAELYCAGVSAEILAAAGFSERTEQSENVLPNYLTPPLFENTEYYYFTNRPKNFVMFKADGDQDRPNLSVN